MEQDGLGMAKRDLPVSDMDPDNDMLPTEGDHDPLEFFRPQVTHAETAAYAKTHAIQGEPRSILAAWARTARWDLAALALIPITVAGALLAAFQLPVHFDRLFVLALGALGMILGVNLLRNAAAANTRQTPLEVVRASLAAQVGVALFALSLLAGFFVARWAGGTGVALGVVGMALALGYALLAFTLGAVPGEEVVPAVALGPLLFVLTLATQASGKSGQPATAHLVPAVALALARSEVLLAVALGCLMLAVVVARRLGEPTPTKGQTTRALLQRRGIRILFLGALVGAYLFAVLAGVGRGMPHATVAVLLSLPIAILPLSGALLARTDEALSVLRFQARSVAVAFGLWLVGGLIAGALYLHLMAALHTLLKK